MRSRSIALLFACSAILTSCGGGSSGTPAQSLDPAVSIAPSPSPTPQPEATPTTPPPATTVGIPSTVVGADTSEGFPQAAKVSDGLDVAKWLKPSWQTGQIAASNAPDVVGAFRLICAPSHLAYDDPVVFPGQPGRSHLHQFFGNTEADANSTYESLRTSGRSSCGDMMNRSSYWLPALLNGRGQVVVPDYATVYYKRRPANDPECQLGKGCIGLPRGLRYVFGRTMEGTAYAGQRTDGVNFTCDAPNSRTSKSFSEAAAACPTPYRLGVQVGAPDCWDGKHLDTPDHRSHMAFTIHTNGREMCPDTHPYRTPTFHFIVWYTTDDTLDRSGNTGFNPNQWYFSSDRVEGQAPKPSGSTVHSDWFGAWNDEVLSRWIGGCINRFLNCSGGDLGDGKQLIGASQPTYGWKNPNRLVNVPNRPS